MKRLPGTSLLLFALALGCVGYVGTVPTGTGAAGTGGPGLAGTTGAAGTSATGLGGTTGVAGISPTGVSGTTGSAGTSAAGGRGGTTGTAGTTAAGGRGGTTGTAGTTAAGGRAGTTGTAGTTGSGGTQGSCPPACGPSVTDFYDNSKLATIRITFNQADTGTYTPAQWLDLLWSKWNHCPPFDASDLVRVTFQYESPDGKGNAMLSDVGMRLRGSMRRDYNQLQGFKLDFQKLLGTATGAARRRFADNNRLNLLSIESDASHMLQCLAYKTKRDFGLPSPYCNHLKVYVNGTYYGLMESVEEPEIGRFQAHHGSPTARPS